MEPQLPGDVVQQAAPAVDTSLFGQIFAALVAHPTACMLTLALLALAYLYKARMDDHAKFFDAISKKEADHRATLEKVIPVAENLNQTAVLLGHIIEHVKE